MAATWAICRRDLLFLFSTPLAWLVLACWALLTNGIFHFGGLDRYWNDPDTSAAALASGEPLYRFGLITGAYLLTLLAPAITMNSFAHERVHGTLQLLLTVPIKEHQLVLGKFLAVFLMLLAMVASTLVQPLVLYFVSDTGGVQTVSAYFGMVLLCALLAGIGVWISLLVDHPIAAYVITFGVIAVLQLVGLIGVLGTGVLAAIADRIGLGPRFLALFEGDARLDHVVYFVAGTAIFLTLAHGALAARRVHG